MEEKLRILLVDNNQMDRELAEDSLALGVGHEVTTASSAAEANVLALSQFFDVIISDYHMPDSDGITFLQSVLSTPGLENMPAILLTAVSDSVKLPPELIGKVAVVYKDWSKLNSAIRERLSGGRKNDQPPVSE